MRWLGAVFIFAAALSMGLGCIARNNAHRICLHDLCTMLRSFKAELSSRKPGLPELCRRTKANSHGRAEAFLDQLCKDLSSLGVESFPKLWAEAAEKSICELSPTELNCFKELGLSLGRYTLERQLEEIGLCLTLLQGAEENLIQGTPELRKLSLGLSLTAASILTIVLA